jgi:hypothetical protein
VQLPLDELGALSRTPRRCWTCFDLEKFLDDLRILVRSDLEPDPMTLGIAASAFNDGDGRVRQAHLSGERKRLLAQNQPCGNAVSSGCEVEKHTFAGDEPKGPPDCWAGKLPDFRGAWGELGGVTDEFYPESV